MTMSVYTVKYKSKRSVRDGDGDHIEWVVEERSANIIAPNAELAIAYIDDRHRSRNDPDFKIIDVVEALQIHGMIAVNNAMSHAF